MSIYVYNISCNCRPHEIAHNMDDDEQLIILLSSHECYTRLPTAQRQTLGFGTSVGQLKPATRNCGACAQEAKHFTNNRPKHADGHESLTAATLGLDLIR